MLLSSHFLPIKKRARAGIAIPSTLHISNGSSTTTLGSYHLLYSQDFFWSLLPALGQSIQGLWANIFLQKSHQHTKHACNLSALVSNQGKCQLLLEVGKCCIFHDRFASSIKDCGTTPSSCNWPAEMRSIYGRHVRMLHVFTKIVSPSLLLSSVWALVFQSQHILETLCSSTKMVTVDSKALQASQVSEVSFDHALCWTTESQLSPISWTFAGRVPSRRHPNQSRT